MTTPDNTTPSTTRTEAATVADLAWQAMEITVLETGDPEALAAFTPAGEGRMQLVDLQHLARGPRASDPREVTVYNPESLVAYCQAHLGGEQGRIVYDPTALTVTAILDEYRWASHRATLRLQRTPEWNDWNARDGKGMNQEQFADFVEDHTPDFSNPSAADMLELALTFHAAESAKFTSGVRLSSGETRLTYEQEINATAGKSGQIEVPSTITLVLRPFEGSPPTEITARFRFRLNSGKLSMGYVLDRPHEVARAAFDAVCGQVSEGLDDWLHTVGKP